MTSKTSKLVLLVINKDIETRITRMKNSNELIACAMNGEVFQSIGAIIVAK